MSKTILKIFIGLLVSLLLLIISVEFFSFNNSYIYTNMNKEVNISNEDLYKTVEQLTSFFKKDVSTLDFYIYKDNKKVKAFNETEIKHLVDVKNIYTTVRLLKYSLIFIIGFLFFHIRKKYIINSFYYGAIISIIVTIFLGLIVNLNFNKSFILFHEIAFSNDLWLLNPETDLIIQLVPLNFFIKISKDIILSFIALNILLTFITFKIKKALK